MRYLFFILLFVSVGAYGQAPKSIYFVTGNANDTANDRYNMYISKTVRLPFYAQSDTNKVLTIDANGFPKFVTKGGGSSADSTVFTTIYRDDTGKTRLTNAVAVKLNKSDSNTLGGYMTRYWLSNNGIDFNYAAQVHFLDGSGNELVDMNKDYILVQDVAGTTSTEINNGALTFNRPSGFGSIKPRTLTSNRTWYLQNNSYTIADSARVQVLVDSVAGQNIMKANLTADTSHTQEFAGYKQTWNNMGGFTTVDASGDTTLDLGYTQTDRSSIGGGIYKFTVDGNFGTYNFSGATGATGALATLGDDGTLGRVDYDGSSTSYLAGNGSWQPLPSSSTPTLGDVCAVDSVTTTGIYANRFILGNAGNNYGIMERTAFTAKSLDLSNNISVAAANSGYNAITSQGGSNTNTLYMPSGTGNQNWYAVQRNGTDTIAGQSWVEGRGYATTSAVADSVSGRQKYSDTSTWDASKAYVTTAISGKQNFTDTTTWDATKANIAGKMNYTDTAALSNRINLKSDIASPTFTGTVSATTINLNTPTSTGGALNMNGNLLSVSNGATPISLTNPLADFEGSANGVMQINIRNASSGAGASSDLVVTANDGTDVSNYGNFGVNGSGHVGSGLYSAPRDVYAYASDYNFVLGTWKNKDIIFGTGDTTAASERLRISGTGAFTLWDGATIGTGTVTGTKIGTSTSQKLGFYNATPVVQQTGNISTALSNLGLVTSGTIALASNVTGVLPAANGGDPFTYYTVSGSDFTTTSVSLVNITGLVTGTLPVSKKFEFEATLYCGTTAVTTGLQFGTNVTVAPNYTYALVTGATTTATNRQTIVSQGIAANNTATTQAYLTTASVSGQVYIRGFFETAGSGSPVFSLQVLKVTSGTATIFQGSSMKIRQVN